MKDTSHDSIWDNDSGFSYQHQTSTAHSGPSGPSTHNYHALKQNSGNQQQSQQHQQNSHKKYRDSFETEIQKQFDTQMQQQASSNHEEAATAPHASYSLYTHHTEHQPSRQHQQQQNQQYHHQHDSNNNFEGQESQHMSPVYYHPPSNTGATAHEDANDLFDALIEASHREISQTFPRNTQFQPEPQPQFAGGRQFSFHVPQQVQKQHHGQQHLLDGEEMMSQASQPQAIIVAPPPAFVSPIPILHPPQHVQLLKITQPITRHK